MQPVAALQSEYSLWTRDIESQILPTLDELNIGTARLSNAMRQAWIDFSESPNAYASFTWCRAIGRKA